MDNNKNYDESRMPNQQLTRHFSLLECCRSRKAKELDIPNIPFFTHKMRLRNTLGRSVEPARDFFANRFIITSGYRCEMLNRMIGGSSTSQHLSGEAIDFQMIDDENHVMHEQMRDVFEWMKRNVPYDQLILESKTFDAKEGVYHYWIHVSCKVKSWCNRNQSFEMRDGKRITKIEVRE